MLSSDFFGARLQLECAFVALHGEDAFSIQAREAIGLLIYGCATRELSQAASADNVLHFPNRNDPDQ